MSKEFGLIIQTRRQAMEMSLNALALRMGGSPGPSFLSKIESGKIMPTREVAERLGDALAVPKDTMLNAAGYTDPAQQEAAIEAVRKLLFEQPPVMQSIPVWDQEGPTGQMRPRMLRQREECRAIDLRGEADLPFIGEVIYSLDREPSNGAGVIAVVGGRRGAWKWQNGTIANGAGEVRSNGFAIEGVIIRVTTEMDLG